MTTARAMALIGALVAVVVVIARRTMRTPQTSGGRAPGPSSTRGSAAATTPRATAAATTPRATAASTAARASRASGASSGPRSSTGRSTGGTQGLADKTRSELYELAKKADIPGRSSMSKQQLLAALTRT